MKTFTEADMARAWEAGHRWCYDGGGEADNPHEQKESDAGSPAKKNTDAATETPSKEISNES